jgi:hypothetical protein
MIVTPLYLSVREGYNRKIHDLHPFFRNQKVRYVVSEVIRRRAGMVPLPQGEGSEPRTKEIFPLGKISGPKRKYT